MALYGVVADIHGNREALSAALAFLDGAGITRLLCLGDIVGYNADPDECTQLVRERNALAIAGNHDLIGLGRLDMGRCSNKARYSLKRTRRRLGPEAARYLAALPANRVIEDGIVLIHGGVRDVEQYMVSPAHIRQNALYARDDFPAGRVFLFGHTHEQKVFEVDGPQVRDIPIAPSMPLRRDRLYFINAGSVDPSRKRAHKLAECAVFDSDAWRIDFHRLAYDHAETESRAAAAGYRIGPWTDRLYSLRARFIALHRKFSWTGPPNRARGA
jgi:predicted phosphodiesterase